MSRAGNRPDPEVAEHLGLVAGASRHRRRWLWWMGLVGIAVAVGGLWLLGDGGQEGPSYRTAEVRRGELKVEVTATGKLQPVTQVDVGTEVSGTVNVRRITSIQAAVGSAS